MAFMVDDEPIIVGLVGQVCAGKSAVAEMFRKHHVQVYDADKAVHDLYKRPDVIAEVVKKFGPGILDTKGTIDRKALGKIVFSDAKKLAQLTREIIFPRTGAQMQAVIDQFRKSRANMLVLDAPSLFEAGREYLCNYILHIAAPIERREEWAQKRGWPPGEVRRRESMMIPDSEKRKHADMLLANSGTLEELERRVGRLFWNKPFTI